MTQRTDFEPDLDFSAFPQHAPSDEAPAGLEFDLDSPTLVNQLDADGFNPQIEAAVDGLLWLGFLTSSFTIFGHSFQIKTLTRGERLVVTQITEQYADSIGLSLALETATVAASLVMVDGVPQNPPLGATEDPLVRIQKNYETINSWYDPLIAALYDKYNALTLKQAAAFSELRSKSLASPNTY